MTKLFAGSLNRSHWVGPFKAKADTPVVRLMDLPRRLPGTAVERRVISTLKEAGPVSFAKLVTTIAGEVYAEELRKGSGVLDIGLFGSRLFNSDVIRELEEGNGVLWEISPARSVR
jgi:hypothetical protein